MSVMVCVAGGGLLGISLSRFCLCTQSCFSISVLSKENSIKRCSIKGNFVALVHFNKPNNRSVECHSSTL